MGREWTPNEGSIFIDTVTQLHRLDSNWTVPKYRSNSVYTSSYKRHRTVQYGRRRGEEKKREAADGQSAVSD